MPNVPGETTPQRLASRLIAYTGRPGDEPPSVSEIIQRAEDRLDIVNWAVAPVSATGLEKWKAHILIQWDDEAADEERSEFASEPERARPPSPASVTPESEPPGPGQREYEVWLQRQAQLDDWHFDLPGMPVEERDAARECPWCIGVGVEFGLDCLSDFHRLVRTIVALAPETPIVLDIASCCVHSGQWARDAAECRAPPHPRNLFMIHQVMDVDPEAPRWFHTHGLLRCGSVEFELIDVAPEFSAEAVELLTTVAIAAVEHGPGAPRRAFSPGADIHLQWLPWSDLPWRMRGVVGARPEDRDDYHRLPSGVLVERRGVWPFRSYQTPLTAFEIMQCNPAMYISDMETRRMERLASLRFDMFRRVFQRFSEDEGWAFFIKFGYPIEKLDDSAEGDVGKEHLWFLCKDLNDDSALAELVNDPHHIASMRSGQTRWRPLDLMTDWQIHTPERRYDPDSVISLPEAREL